MAERTCTNCGATVPDGARFCTSCGTEVPPATAPEPSTEPVAPTTQLPPSEPAAPSWTPPAAAAPPQQPQSWSVPPPQAPPTQANPAPPTWQPPQQQQPAWGAQPQQQPWGAQPAYGAAPAPARKKGNVLGGLLAFVGAILLVAGSFTQWLRTNVKTYSGWDVSVDGKVVIGLAVVAVIVGFLLIAGVRNIVLRLALVALGVWAIVIAIVDIVDVGNQPDALQPAIGVGLVLVAIAGAVLLLGGLVTRSKA
ncbi:MAG: zinc-ribbon domain-containing protein [Acidimicrobiia bacterium]|nr:zinc-ribbon domain-containing protein [Acidimicrobiia bacterium]